MSEDPVATAPEIALKWDQVRHLYTCNSAKAPLRIKAYITKGRGRRATSKWYVFHWTGIGLITYDDPTPEQLAEAVLVED
jgi:hypothetical protein